MSGNSGIGLGEVAALITVAAVLTYLLGLIAIVWPVYRRITNDIHIAWYAASLMPRTVVTWQGIHSFLGLPITMTLVVITGLLLSRFFEELIPIWQGFPAFLVALLLIMSVAFYF